MIALAFALTAAAAADDGAASAPVETGDWLAWCTPDEGCTAELAPAGGAPAIGLSLVSATGSGGVLSLEIRLPASVPRGGTVRLALDGKVAASLVAPGGGGGLALPLTAPLGPALRRARTLALLREDGRPIARVALTGLARALALLDRPATRAEIAAVQLPARGSKPPRTLSTKEAAKLIPAQPCRAAAPGVVRAVRLDPATSLALVAAPCGDDYILQPLLVDESGRTRVADIADAGAVERADWDAVAHRLVVADPPTPSRRCVAERRYAWNGARFVPAERRYLCRGRAAPIVTWRAPVVQR